MLFKKITASFFDAKFLSSSSIIFAGSFVVNVLNYVFTLVLSRLMGIEAFGEVTAMLSLLLVISVPSAALSMLMTREVASRSTVSHDGVRELFFFLRRHIARASLVLWFLVLVSLPLLSRFLHIGYVPLIIFSLLIPFMVMTSLQSGTLTGLQKFFMLAKQNVLGTAIKLVVSVILVMVGFSVSGVMTALVLAQLFSVAYGRFATHKTLGAYITEAKPLVDTRALRTLFFAILLTTFLLTLLSNVDVLLAKHFLTATLAGQYGALSTLGKIIMYGVGAFAGVLLPMAAAAHARGLGGEKRILALSVVVVTGASLVAMLVFNLFPDRIVSLLFGARYQDIAPYLGMFAFAMSCISIATTFINYFVAIRNTTFMYFLALGIGIEVVCISLDHASLGGITSMLALSSVLLLVLMVVNYFFIRTSHIT